MADLRPDGDTADTAEADEAAERSAREDTVGAPRWVKVFGVIALVLVALVVVLLLLGGGPGGGHGPGRHGM